MHAGQTSRDKFVASRRISYNRSLSRAAVIISVAGLPLSSLTFSVGAKDIAHFERHMTAEESIAAPETPCSSLPAELSVPASMFFSKF